MPRPDHPLSASTIVSAVLAVFTILTAASRAEVVVDDDGTFVIDRAQVFDQESETRLENWLRELEQKTTAQVKVLTVPTTEDEPIFNFSQGTYDRWKLGTEREDNGALIVLAVQDRKVRIHTGYGMEPILPDSWCGTNSRDVAANYFRQGAYAEGLSELALRVAHRIAAEEGVELTGVPAPQGNPEGEISWGLLLFLLIAFFIFMYWLSRSQRRWAGRHVTRRGGDWWFAPTSTWGDRGGSFGSRGFGGGFGGGGFGGSFGGGGMSGGGGGGASW